MPGKVDKVEAILAIEGGVLTMECFSYKGEWINEVVIHLREG